MPKTLWLLVLACLAQGCAARTSPITPRSNDAARRGFWSVVDTLALTRAAATARYGRPAVVRADTVRNHINPAIIDSVVYLRFPGFEAYYYVHADGRIALRDITMTGYITRRDSLIARIGAPEEEMPHEGATLLFFEIPPRDQDNMGNVLNVLVDGNRVRSISWIFFPERTWPRDYR